MPRLVLVFYSFPVFCYEQYACCIAVVQIAEKIRLSLQPLFTLTNSQRQILPRIGIALFPQYGTDEQQLLRQADIAMYVAKRNGGSAVHFAD